MQKSKALVVGSYYEGFGRMSAEAAFNKCIIIGRNTAGTKEIMNAVGGFAFMTTEELTKRMLTVSQLSEEEFHYLTTTAQNNATRLFSIEQNITKTMMVYKKIIS